MPLPNGKIQSGLQKKGFVKKDRSHKTFRYIALDGTQTSVFTYCSHGPRRRDVKDGVIGAMARQCKISTKQFRQLVGCPLAREKYEELLCKCGILEDDYDELYNPEDHA